jgi:predicted TIM-barrel enzyme
MGIVEIIKEIQEENSKEETLKDQFHLVDKKGNQKQEKKEQAAQKAEDTIITCPACGGHIDRKKAAKAKAEKDLLKAIAKSGLSAEDVKAKLGIWVKSYNL